MRQSKHYQRNAERNADIVRRRQAGAWPTEIAKALGMTRNAVLGVLNRAGMCSPDTPRGEVMKTYGPRGEGHGNACLTESEVRAIRREYQPYHREFGRVALAARYGVKPSTITSVTHRKSWGHVA